MDNINKESAVKLYKLHYLVLYISIAVYIIDAIFFAFAIKTTVKVASGYGLPWIDTHPLIGFSVFFLLLVIATVLNFFAFTAGRKGIYLYTGLKWYNMNPEQFWAARDQLRAETKKNYKH